MRKNVEKHGFQQKVIASLTSAKIVVMKPKSKRIWLLIFMRVLATSTNTSRAIALKCGTIINMHNNQVVSILHNPETEQIIKTVNFNTLILNDYFFNAIALVTSKSPDTSLSKAEKLNKPLSSI